MKISLIAAVSNNFVIGKDNDLIWHLPDDMSFFKSKTENHHILTGRKNYESIPLKYRPLKNRVNVIITRDENYDGNGGIVFNSIEDGIKYAEKNGEDELFIIGGGQIYKQAISRADRLYITWVNAELEGDAFFPQFDFNSWKLVKEDVHPADEKHHYSMRFCVYERYKVM